MLAVYNSVNGPNAIVFFYIGFVSEFLVVFSSTCDHHCKVSEPIGNWVMRPSIVLKSGSERNLTIFNHLAHTVVCLK